jgi:feruloyl esterase
VPILQPKDIELLNREATHVCDRDDGVQDGIIGNAIGCRFSPKALACRSDSNGLCLNESQVQAAEKIYAGPGLRTPNMLVGSELRWPLQDRNQLLDRYTPYFQSIFLGASPELTPAFFNFERDMKRIGLGYSIPKVDNPDLRSFKEAGGKLIAYLGANDSAFVTDIIDYYEVVERTMGGRTPTQDFFRLFVVPGMNHCRGGIGPFAIDYLSYIEAWVQQGKAPNALIGLHVTGVSEFVQFPLSSKAMTVFERPVFPYPSYAKYKGMGNPKRAESFYAVDSAAGPVIREN